VVLLRLAAYGGFTIASSGRASFGLTPGPSGPGSNLGTVTGIFGLS